MNHFKLILLVNINHFHVQIKHILLQSFQLFLIFFTLQPLIYFQIDAIVEDKIDARIKEVLDNVHLENCENKMPYELSGGEQQRATIARALLNHPKIILADEPTGNLDPEKSERIIGLLKEINDKGTTIIVATHDYSIIKKFPSHTFVCKNRSLVETSSENL